MKKQYQIDKSTLFELKALAIVQYLLVVIPVVFLIYCKIKHPEIFMEKVKLSPIFIIGIITCYYMRQKILVEVAEKNTDSSTQRIVSLTQDKDGLKVEYEQKIKHKNYEKYKYVPSILFGLSVVVFVAGFFIGDYIPMKQAPPYYEECSLLSVSLFLVGIFIYNYLNDSKS